MYRPRNTRTEILEVINQFVENLDAENQETILVSDFNSDLLTDNEPSLTSRLVDMINFFQLTQVIEEPSRVISDTQTLLDLLITIKPENIIKSGVVHIATIVSYLVVENHLWVKTSLKLSKLEIISVINLLGRALTIRLHYGNSLGTDLMKSPKYTLQSDKGESEVNMHLGQTVIKNLRNF